jgi:hypothetical protein|tara:strand:- start:465 stop:668 length:204 start_codon:yes stop_codon:yes gene_type:complete
VAIRHDLGRRRTLKKKSELLKQYGMRALFMAYALFGAAMLNKHILNPPEYSSEEEEKCKFSILIDLL